MQTQSAKFAFLVHPRDLHDLCRKYPVARFMPKGVLSWVTGRLPPVVLAEVRGLKNLSGVPVPGFIAAVTMTAKDMLDRRDLARRKVGQAVSFARKLGATHIGLGAFTSVVTEGGAALLGKHPDICLTNGNALAAFFTYAGIRKAMKRRGMERPCLAIIGATGSVGGAVSALAAQSGAFSRVYIVGRTPEHVEALLRSLYESGCDRAVAQAASFERAVSGADIILTATNAVEALVTAPLPKEGCLIYDIAQPPNVSPALREERPDVMVLDGALAQPPGSVSWKFNLGTPRGTTFACMAETMLLAAAGHKGDFCLGKATLDQVEYVKRLAGEHHFTLAPFTGWGKPIPGMTDD